MVTPVLVGHTPGRTAYATSPVSWSSEEFIDGVNDPVFGHGVASGTLILQ